MTPEAALEWLESNRAHVRWLNNSVKVRVHDSTKRRKTLAEAIAAHELDIGRRPNETRCRAHGCGRVVLWLSNAQGKRIPVDPIPVNGILDPQGDLVLVLRDGSSKNARLPLVREIPDVTGHVSHRTTCADSEAFQKTRIGEDVTQ